MAREEPAIVRVIGEVEELIDATRKTAIAEHGAVTLADQRLIDDELHIEHELEAGNAARLESQAVANSWNLTETYRTRRRKGELRRDLGLRIA